MAVTKTKSGRYKAVVDVGGRGADRKRQTAVFDTRAEAEAWHELMQRRDPTDRRRTLLDAVDRAIERKRAAAVNGSRKPSYVNTLLATRDTYVAATYLGEIELDRLTVDDLERFYDELYAGEHRPAKFKGQPASRSTVHKVHRLVHLALRGAKRARWVAANVAAEVEVAETITDAGAAPKPSAADDYDLGDIAATLDYGDAELVDLAQCGLATGARAGELAGLRWRDVGLVDGAVTFHGSISKPLRGEGTGWVRTKTKTGKARSVTVDEACRAMLQRRYREQIERAEAAGMSGEQLERCAVFSLELERDYTSPAALGARWRRAVAKATDDDAAEVAALRLHDLRHVNASEMRAGGVPDSAGMKRTGHTTQRMYADQYGHHRADDDGGLATAVLADTWAEVARKRAARDR